MMEKIRLHILIAATLLSAASCPFTENKDEELFVYYSEIPRADAEAVTGKRFDYTIAGNEAVITHYIGPYEDIPILEAPSKIEDKPVTRIGENAFADCRILSASLPEGLKAIEARGFFNNRLSAIAIPSTVTALGEGAFSNNYLTGIVKIPNGVTVLGGSAFQHNNLSGVSFGTGLTVIGPYAFAYNALVHLDIPASIIVIEAGAFFKNDIDRIRIGNGVEIKSDSSLGTYGASFRAYYDAHGKKSGVYTYAHTTKEWTGA